MYWFIGECVKNSIDIMVEATAIQPLSSPVWRAAIVVVEIYSLMGMVAGVTAYFRPSSLGLSTQKTINTSHLLDLHLQ